MSRSKTLSSTGARKYKKPFEDITAYKTAQIYELKLQVEDAKKLLAIAEASFESYAAKSSLFDTLLAQAVSRLTVMTSEDNLAVDSAQKTNSLYKTSKKAIATANDTYADTRMLLKSVQGVVTATLDAATDIALSAELIMKRKAANPLISSDLVTEASQAATDANKAVSLIINTLTSTFNALATANQANNTAEIALIEINYLKEQVVKGNSSVDALVAMSLQPIETEAKLYYQEARSTEKEAQEAADVARQEMIKAKNELTSATANLANSEAALNAAEAAVGS